jgi:hypothetical protein
MAISRSDCPLDVFLSVGRNEYSFSFAVLLVNGARLLTFSATSLTAAMPPSFVSAEDDDMSYIGQ